MRNSHFQTGPSGSPRSQGMVAPASLKTRHRQKRAVPTRGPLPLRPIATTLQFTPWLQLCEQPYLQRTNRNNTSSLGSNCVSSHICKGHSAKDIGCVRGGSGGGGGSTFKPGFISSYLSRRSAPGAISSYLSRRSSPGYPFKPVHTCQIFRQLDGFIFKHMVWTLCNTIEIAIQ